MKIKSMRIRGFRGFNEERPIQFHHSLTLIYGPNSYGKTSVTEALEWLLYGVTSKVQAGDDYKEEYKGSYRNRHFPEHEKPAVEVTFTDGATDICLRAELDGQNTITRWANGVTVSNWAFLTPGVVARPFILQHALQDLLLARPDERFQQFAQLLGLQHLDEIHRNIIAFCNAPPLPPSVVRLCKEVDLLEDRLSKAPFFADVAKKYRKAPIGAHHALVLGTCRKHLPKDTPDDMILPQLLQMREDAVARHFAGRLSLPAYTDLEKNQELAEDEYLGGFVTQAFLDTYLVLAKLSTVQELHDREAFYKLGFTFTEDVPKTCPFCGREIPEDIAVHIRQEYQQLTGRMAATADLREQHARVQQNLRDLDRRCKAAHERHISKVASLLAHKDRLPQLRAILRAENEIHSAAVEHAIVRLGNLQTQLMTVHAQLAEQIAALQQAVSENNASDVKPVKSLGQLLVQYIADARTFREAVQQHAPPVAAADQVLKNELDKLAGTEHVSLLIELLEKRKPITQRHRITEMREGLKEFRRTTDQFVAKKVDDAISGDMTTLVMDWYQRIKTTGDPDVHFGGFGLQQTAAGDYRARRVGIKAKSYGKDLVSAVACLSESKLNALGLCLSIACTLKGTSPFDFLFIDDPIQSWDVEHETQFVEVLRELVQRGKQVVLLSHNRKWIAQVRTGCRTLEGHYYELTGYTQAGPEIIELPWVEWQKRLNDINAIAADPKATSESLQRAEQEVRIVACQLTSELYKTRRGIDKSPAKMNADDVRRMLQQSGVDSRLVDKIHQTFGTTDDAHHAPVDYASNRQRILRYHSYLHELAQQCKN